MSDIYSKIASHGKMLGITFISIIIFTSLVLYLAGAPPYLAYYHILAGSLGSWVKFTHVIQTFIPLALCSLGLLYTFRINLWNIGIEGQIMMGAVFTTLVLRMDMEAAHPVITLCLALPAGIIGGGLWAALAGILKTKGGINEIFAGLGLNFVAQGALLWLIFGPWKRPGIASMSGTEQFREALWLPYIKSLRISPPAILLFVVMFIITAFLLYRFKIGLYLKAIGENSKASNLYGLKINRYLLMAMLFAGGFAGLAGGIQVAGVYHRLIPAISSNYGYLALLVVMLSRFGLWLTPFVALFFACLNVGSIQLPMMLELDSSLSGVIQGALVLITLAVYSYKKKANS